jgi:hypothetical protein
MFFSLGSWMGKALLLGKSSGTFWRSKFFFCIYGQNVFFFLGSLMGKAAGGFLFLF